MAINFKKLEEIAYALMPKYRGDMRSFHVAAIYRKSKLVSIGFNKDVTHPKIKKYKYHRLAKVHAELNCVLRGGREDYEGYDIAVLRINRNNKLDYSAPCSGCSHLLCSLGINKVFYTDQEGQWVENSDLQSNILEQPHRFEEEDSSN